MAIASVVAAEVHNIHILASNIEDSPDNTTRFLVLCVEGVGPPPPKQGEDVGDRRDKTFLGFTVNHTQPGALCDSLEVFKEYNLNLTSIASRPSRITPWNYFFFVEFVGNKEDDQVKKALNKMRNYCFGFKVWGSFRDKQKRLQNKT